MTTETITIRVDARAAQAFKSAPEAQRQKLEQLLSFRLLAAAQMHEPLESLMRRISQNAQRSPLAVGWNESCISRSMWLFPHSNL